MTLFILQTESFSPFLLAFHNSQAPLEQNAYVSHRTARRLSRRFIIPPPGSGYFRPEDEVSELPDSYEPMMEYPGTMRPGRTPENMPYHDLPIGDNDPDPVPWPHFQQIEWHHRWDPPHPHPVTIEEVIEKLGRWATPEQEAEMRSSSRSASRRQREITEGKKREAEPLIMDDDDDDPRDLLPQDLGDGIFGILGSADARKITEKATSPQGQKDATREDDDEFDDDPGLDDFLLDLGLDSLVDDDDDQGNDDDDDDGHSEKEEIVVTADREPSSSTPLQGLEDVVIVSDDRDESIIEEDNFDPQATASIDVDDEDDLDLGLDDDNDLENSMEVPLEDFGDSDTLDVDDFFDDGGFDYDGDFDGGDFDDGF